MSVNKRIVEIGQKPPRPKLRLKAKGGAPKGNRNALKHGTYTAQWLAMERRLRAFLRRGRMMETLAHAARNKNA